MIIWKYELAITELQLIDVSIDAEFLSVDNQRGQLCLWIMLDPLQKTHRRRIEVFGTGHEMDLAKRKFIGTVLIGSFVWHVFERLA